MTGAHSRTAVLVVGLAMGSLVLAGCDSRRGQFSVGDPVAPTSPAFSVSSTSSIAVHAAPLPLPLVPVTGFGCPFAQPFQAPFNLVIVGDHSVDFVLTQVQFSPFDLMGVPGDPLLISTNDLNARFGSTTIPAGTSRAFPFSPQFGCGLSHPGSLGIQVTLVDPFGRPRPLSVTAPLQ